MDAQSLHNPCHAEQEAVKVAAQKRAIARTEYARRISPPDGQGGEEAGVVDVAAAKTARRHLDAAEKELLRARKALLDCQVLHGIT
jgi:hypothetical protein